MIRRMRTNILLALAGLGLGGVASADWQDDFSLLLQRHVKGRGVDYRGWRADRADASRLREVVGAIGMEAPAGTRNQRLAWYLNAYNALVLHQVLDAPQADGGGVVAVREDLFKVRENIVAGESLSLDKLERTVIGPTFRDPRIHFALHRASIGGPPPRNRAFVAATLNADLNAITRDFLSGDPQGIRVSADGLTVEVSALFAWFREDFDRGDLRSYINRYRAEPLPASARIRFLAYDWERDDSRP